MDTHATDPTEFITKWHHVLGYGSTEPDILVVRTPPLQEIVSIRGDVELFDLDYLSSREPAGLRDLRFDMWLPLDGAGIQHLDRFGDGTGLVGTWSYVADVEDLVLSAMPNVSRVMLRRHGIGRKIVAGPRHVPRVTFLNPHAIGRADESSSDRGPVVRTHDLSRLLRHVRARAEQRSIRIIVDETDDVMMSPLWKMFRDMFQQIGVEVGFDGLLHAIAGNESSDADMFATEHRGANYARRDFSNADLGRADLSGAVLRGCSFVNADLTNANISGADLTDAVFTGAEMTGIMADERTLITGGISGLQAFSLKRNPVSSELQAIIHGTTAQALLNSENFPV
ncbi:MAG: pentapeptide repeat-containing protein [Ignavibacteria bacterium]|nr:pentapeptide repeat-containing protein [Ignavibacteria bacterium]